MASSSTRPPTPVLHLLHECYGCCEHAQINYDLCHISIIPIPHFPALYILFFSHTTLGHPRPALSD